MDWVDIANLSDEEIQRLLIESNSLPRHVAVIMDGNGRWALERGLSRTDGHREGIESVREIVEASAQLKIQFLTLYAFSIENWKRPLNEVGVLMKLLEHYLIKELDELNKNNIRLLAIGKLNSLPKVVQKQLFNAIEKTSKNTGLTLTLALSYSGRWDIVRAVQMIALDVRRGKVSPEDINDELFSSYLQTNSIPDPDLLIRTSGEMRLSNFLLWEMAYSEIYISNKYWPQFRRKDYYEALCDYIGRERRFGRISAQLDTNETQKAKQSYLQKILNIKKV